MRQRQSLDFTVFAPVKCCAGWLSGAFSAGLVAAEATRLYRPRHPERSAIYQLLEMHFQDYLYAHEERFEPGDGPLRAVVPTTVDAYLGCGRPQGGFARLTCDSCGGEHQLPAKAAAAQSQK